MLRDDPPPRTRPGLWQRLTSLLGAGRAAREARLAEKRAALESVKEDAAQAFIAVLRLKRGRDREAMAAYDAAAALRAAAESAAPYARVRQALEPYPDALDDFLYAKDVREVMQRRVTLNLYQALADACDREAARGR